MPLELKPSRRWAAALGLAILAASALALSLGRIRAPVRVVVRVTPGAAIDLSRASWKPADAVRAARLAADQLELDVDPAELRLGAPQACSKDIVVESRSRGTTVAVELSPWLSARGPELAQIGYETPFRIVMEPGCDEARAGRLSWRQTEGAPLVVTTEQDGWVLNGRTASFADAHPGPAPWGIVPVSPRTRGEAVFEITWEGPGGARKTEVRLSAAARAGGVPSVVVGQRLLLGGRDWRVRDRPPGAQADATRAGELWSVQPDVAGAWTLSDGDGRELLLTAGVHTFTPLDCGRSDCHAREAEASRDSPMTSSMKRGLIGNLDTDDPACALACHATGEPGLRDGGFVHVLASLEWPRHLAVSPGAWDALPRPLRRLGGVGCTACHGTAAIPAPSARWAILRADVCASCHDAPPRYSHVEAWQRSRMARADRDADARSQRSCRGCHTTSGFLDRVGLREERSRPDPDLEMGIACAACHAAHGAHDERALVRRVAPPAGLGPLPAQAEATALCTSCHASPTGAGVAASAATLLYGSAPGKRAPHADVPRGCLGCHGAPASESPGERGRGHDFLPSARACDACHAGDGWMAKARDEGKALRARAERIGAGLGLTLGDRPPHARALPSPADPKRAAAWRAVLTVLEDPAAGVHNAPYARALLDEAERSANGQAR